MRCKQCFILFYIHSLQPWYLRNRRWASTPLSPPHAHWPHPFTKVLYNPILQLLRTVVQDLVYVQWAMTPRTPSATSLEVATESTRQVARVCQAHVKEAVLASQYIDAWETHAGYILHINTPAFFPAANVEMCRIDRRSMARVIWRPVQRWTNIDPHVFFHATSFNTDSIKKHDD